MNVCIIGGGVAGLSCAYALQELGNQVTIIEKNKQLGGFVRTEYDKLHYYTEHAPRVFFDNYYNFNKILKQIPLFFNNHETDKTLFDIYQPLGSNYLVSKYGLTTTSVFKVALKLNPIRILLLGIAILRYMTFCTKRLEKTADKVSVKRFIDSPRFRMLSHILGEPLEQLPVHKLVRLVEQNISINQGLYVLKGPNQEYLFDNFELYLKKIGVKIIKDSQVELIEKVGDMKYNIKTDKSLFKDFSKVVVATDLWNMINLFRDSNIFVDHNIFELSSRTKSNQLGLSIYFNQPINFKEKSIFAIEDSDWKLIVEPKDSNWKYKTKIGIWSVSIPDDRLLSTRLGKAMKDCSPNEIFQEVWYQIYSSAIFDVCEVPRQHIVPMHYRIWSGWDTNNDFVVNKEPYFLNAVDTCSKRPGQFIGMKDIFLAGAYTKTSYYHYWVEGACESGLKAAQLIDYRVQCVEHQRLLKVIHRIDNFLCEKHLPSFFDISLFFVLVFIFKGGKFLK